MKTGLFLLLFCTLALSACDKKEQKAAEPSTMDVDGMVVIGRSQHEVVSCGIGEKGLDQELELELADGALLKLPIHGSELTYRPSLNEAEKALECAMSGLDGGGADHYFKGHLDYQCELDGQPLVIQLDIRCGIAP